MLRPFLALCLCLWLAVPARAAAPVSPTTPSSSTIDLNTATLAELDSLPGVGPAKAQAILDHRAQNGPFATVDELAEVPGIGPATLANVRGLLRVGGQATAPPVTFGPPPTATGPSVSTVNVNEATAAELETLPGVGPSKAAAIVESRDAHGPFATCRDLTRVLGVGPATVANLAGRCVVE